MKPQASPKIAPPGKTEEPELLVRARNGDRTAFAQLYTEHHGPIYRYVVSRVRDPYTAEDLTSETFLRALRRIDRFAWRGQDIGAWLVTIARNIVSDHNSLARNRYEMPTADMRVVDRTVGSAEEVALVELVHADLATSLRSALERLTPGQRTVLRRRFLEEQSIQEAADSMSLTPGAVKTMTYRAMRSVEHSLADLRGAA
ncbi:hypothetical protein HY68_01250 [Streptomyces sp. AcH 505]|uniref:sigma-70 family RNA polymerase sigma factor n=1 Tax=Streptomyces sp. AcH 505 TaxID=352211 RepID=UPI000592085E|nr:hypothetical protein HY68_01250 [Streptomyces sp. AcH 505]